MPAYAQSQYEVIAAIVASGVPVVAKMGTVVSRSYGTMAGPVPGQFWATVIFDGSSGTAQPVKCFETVLVAAGDRVGVVRYESEWIITGNYTLRTLADVASQHVFSGTLTTTSATFVDLPDSPTIVCSKMRDATKLRIYVDMSLRVNIAVFIEIAFSVLSDDLSVSYDQLMFRRVLNAANTHTEVGGWVETAVLPGGGYTMVGRWRRASGTTEILTVDVNDSISMRVQEVVVA